MRMPILFVGHGSPMNLIDDNSYTQTFQRLGRELPRPQAILCISAHWITAGTQVLTSTQPKQIFDFQGFPEELYQIPYAPPGAPEIAKKLISKNPSFIASETWGLDHGTWAVLKFMYPDANIPTFQISLDTNLSVRNHFKTGETLSYLRDEGVLILASGNLVHSLREIAWSSQSPAHPWAEEFEAESLAHLQNPGLTQIQKVEQLFASPLLKRAHPSPDHLIPLVYALGAAGELATAKVEVKGIQNGSISMATLSWQ